jgi:diamine N-acetyltransferase
MSSTFTPKEPMFPKEIFGPIETALQLGYALRLLRFTDTHRLQAYFDGLSATTRSRFQPHAMNRETVSTLCGAVSSNIMRFVVLLNADIIGYFVLDPNMSEHEAARYRVQGIELSSGIDFLFAPSIADAWQGRKVASHAMPALIEFAKAAGARSLVLMGGTQATNVAAVAFYRKFGFTSHGGYHTGVFNHDMRLCLA